MFKAFVMGEVSAITVWRSAKFDGQPFNITDILVIYRIFISVDI